MQNPIENLENSIKKRNYPNFVNSLEEICKNLGYKEIGKCSEKVEGSELIIVGEIIPFGIKNLNYNIIRSTLGNDCRHYGNKSEGIACRSEFINNLLRDFKIVGYGNVWGDDFIPADVCFPCNVSKKLGLRPFVNKVAIEEIKKVYRK